MLEHVLLANHNDEPSCFTAGYLTPSDPEGYEVQVVEVAKLVD